MIKLFLYPLSWLYGLIIYFRNRLYDLQILKSKEFDIPVISIGNITVGGTGKTPHVEYLVDLLSKDFEVATLSRGYKRKTKGFKLVKSESLVKEVGDEPLQIKKKFPEITVSVCENRVVGVEELINHKNNKQPDVVLLDDAFQHRRITPGINILLIDYNRQIKNDILLPVGRLREGVNQMRRANVIIFTKCPDEVTPIMRRILQKDVKLKPYQSIFFTKFEYEKPKPVFNAQEIDPSFYQKEYEILILTGIAFPQPIFAYLKNYSENAEIISFPDHYNYSENDILKVLEKFESLNSKRKIIITTEKDSVRLKDKSDLPEEFKKVLYYLPIKVKFLGNEEKVFHKRILSYVGENKSNRELHQRKNKS